MTSLILRTATRFLITLLLLFSIFLLVRGHNEPGGGFVAGLVSGAAFVLYAIAFDVDAARRALRVDPHVPIAIGLGVALLAGLVGLFSGDPFMTGQWSTLDLPVLGDVDLGSPFLFDVGVYLVVIGATLTIVFSLAEE